MQTQSTDSTHSVHSPQAPNNLSGQATLEKPKVIQDIPIALIMPNPDNPRGPVPPEAAKSMAESLGEVGQKTEIRVRPLSVEEKNQYPPYEYLLIGGHVRLEGAKLAGLPTLRAVVVPAQSPAQEALDAYLDNENEDMGWWKKDLGIERLLKMDNTLSQRGLAKKLGKPQTRVSKAIRATQYLTAASRELITRNLAQAQPDEDESESPGLTQAPDQGESESRGLTQNKVSLITRRILLILANLKDPQEVEKALGRVFNNHMTEAQVRQMVQDHPQPGPQAEGVAPSRASGQEPPPAVSEQKESNPVKGVEGSGPAPKPSLLSSLFKPSKRGKGSSGSHSLVLGGLAGMVGGFFTANFKRALGTLERRWILQGLLGLGVVGLLVTHWFGSLFHLSPGPQAGGQARVSGNGHLVPNRDAEGNGGTKLGSVQAPNGAQAIEVPPEWQNRVEAGRNLVTEVAINFYGFDHYNPNSWLNAMNDELTAAYSPLFFQDYFPPSKMGDIQRLRLKGSFEFNQPIQLLALDPQNETFLVRGVANIKSDQTEGNQPIRQAQGGVVAQGNVALEVHVVDRPGEKGKVFMVKELAALPFDFTQGRPSDLTQGRAPSDSTASVGTSAKKGSNVTKKTQKVTSSKDQSQVPSAKASGTQGDPLKAVGDAVNGLSNAVNTAKKGESAVDTAKNLLKF